MYLRTKGNGREKNGWWCVNFYEKPADFGYPGEGRAILSNYEQDSVVCLEQVKLRPYEAAIYEVM